MADPIMWPGRLRFTKLPGFNLDQPSRGGGPSITGNEQFVVSPAARWKASAAVSIRCSDDVLAYRWLKNKAQGRTNPVLVPACDARGPANRAGLAGPVFFADGSRFSDGSTFRQSFTGATLGALASLNATQITMSVSDDLSVLPGQRFSFPDGRMHEVVDLVSRGGGATLVTIVPWLRDDYTAGVVLDFDRPVCLMRLAADDTGSLDLDLNRFANPSLEFVEAF